MPEEEKKLYSPTSHSGSALFPFTSINGHASVENDRISGGSHHSRVVSYWNREIEIMLIGIIDEHSLIRECVSRFLQEVVNNLKIIPFKNCEDFLKDPEHYDVILYHAHITDINHNKSDQRFVQITELTKIAPVIILSSTECRTLLIEAFESGARGFIPTTSTTPQQVIEIIRLVKAGGTFAPSSLSLKEGNGSAPSPAITTHQFTPRELAILECLRLGKANKTIAHKLGVSESTVKVHIKGIMIKLKARNRTEVVCRAYGLGNLEALSQPEA